MNTEMDIIVSRYFSGEATEEELRELEVWLSESYENEKQFHQLTLLYQYAGQTGDFPAVDTKKALSKFKTYLAENQKKSSFSLFKSSYLFRAAAAIALLLVSSFAVFYFTQSSKPIQLMAVETIENHKLSENVNVTLFAGAEISYKKTHRTVQLKGKATFNVHSKTAEGIVVQAGETYIEDIGTVFTVDATSPDKSIRVDLAEGEVWFYTKTNAGVHLKPNESAIYNVETKQFQMIEKRNVPIKETLAVGLVFQNTPLREAIDAVKLRYKIDIVVANELNEVLLNANFGKDDPVEYILEIITASISAKLLKKGDTYMIVF